MQNLTAETITTNRLILRRFDINDAGDVFDNWANDKYVQSMYGEPTYSTKNDVKQLLTEYIASYSDDNYYRWAIILKESDECIGQIAFFLVDNKNHFAEIEYCVGRAFQRKGYAKEALKAAISFGFDNINFHRIQVSHMADNEASKNLILSTGFKYEGNFRDYFYKNNKYIDRLYYSILNNEWSE